MHYKKNDRNCCLITEVKAKMNNDELKKLPKFKPLRDKINIIRNKKLEFT